MTISALIGWWLGPLGVTAAAFSWQWWLHKAERSGGDYGQLGLAVHQAITFLGAMVVSLIAWLVWAVLT